MGSILENASTRIIAVYGELSDVFCMPDTRIMNFEEFLAVRLHDLGYEHVVFCSTAKNMFYAVDSTGRAAFEFFGNGSKKKAKKDPPQEKPVPASAPGGGLFDDLVKIGEDSAGESKANERVSGGSDKNKDKDQDKEYYKSVAKDQLNVSANRFMNDTSSAKALVFTSIEDILKISDNDISRCFMENLEEWKALPGENKNICILMSRTLSGAMLQEMVHSGRNSLIESLFISNGVFNSNACLNIGSPLNDEIENLLESLRINGCTVRNKDNSEYTVRLMFRHCGGEKQKIARMLSFYSRADGYTQLKSIKERLENYMISSGKREVWISPEDIAGLYSDTGSRCDLNSDPLEIMKNTEGWEPAYHVLNSFVKNHRMLYGDIADETKTPHRELSVDRFEPGTSGSVFRGRVPNFVLQGPPGVGKTEIAGLIGQILQREGILKSGHTVIGTRDKLVGEYVGSTAIKTAALIDEAQEGVLLVDEVYSLAEKNGENGGISYCNEVFDTLVAAMTNPKYHFCIIFAGYASRMNEVWNMNEGLQSRFGLSNIITLEEYKPVLLKKIFLSQFGRPEGLTDMCTVLSDDVLGDLDTFFENYYEDRDRKNFANARDVKSLADNVKRCANYRHILGDGTVNLSKESSAGIIAEKRDFEDNAALFEKRGLSTADIYSSLNDYIGLGFLAEMFDDQLAVRIECMEKNIPYRGPSHMIWAGNPGTGKSTAAMLTAELYHNLGILGSKEPVYVDASEILSSYAAGAAINMNKKIDEACQKNAVLVLEEAYQLLGSGETDAIHAMLNRMETDRKNFNLILILYKDTVERFLAENPGLRSRMRIYEFPDYNDEQLYSIFECMCRKSADIISSECEENVRSLLKTLYADGATVNGNARIVRQIHESMKQKRFRRVNEQLAVKYGVSVNVISSARAGGTLSDIGNISPEELYTFAAADVPGIDESRDFTYSRDKGKKRNEA